MTIRVLLITLLAAAVASGSSCCRDYKILQFRRAGILPMYDSAPPCGSYYDQDDFCDSSLYPTDPAKYETPVNRYYPPYLEPKSVTQKCVCSKSVASHRVVSTVPRYYKRNYCGEVEPVGSCGHYGCGHYGDCGQYSHCTACGPYGHCGHHACAMPQPIYRQPAHRVLPLTLPASCVC